MSGGGDVPAPQPLGGRRVTLGVTGSISAYKSVEAARRLEDAGAVVDVALTPSAARFVPPLTFRSLVKGEVAADLWDPSAPAEQHVAMGRRAAAMLVAPASATTIAKLAQGIGDNPVTLTALATSAPLVVAPAMDSVMYAQPAVQANLELLKARGTFIAGPAIGRLASGGRGLGRLIEPIELAAAVRSAIGRTVGDLRGRHVIVTAGGTREPIDPVRFVGNHSSGKMGVAVAEAARDQGAAVTLITTQAPPDGRYGIVVRSVGTAVEMQEEIKNAARGANALVMAAAVADYRPAEAAESKLKKQDSDEEGLTLEMVENPDVIASIDAPHLLKVGFAAETDDMIENARAKIEKKGLAFIAANDVTQSDAGFQVDTNRVVLIDASGEPERLPLLHKYDVGVAILERLKSHPDWPVRAD
ncbi:MAG: bifunctional phosphopantothenoylcysteine decarboxylase/phosphopantothenate--cysteine ligase CoaBC [Chloroflexota bacterium]|nr:bifunctional phosphopantothenoylcysteine decarboxylase/phosphopantothenate--cysteine ligase CoaBC [Chloroflexota bacterium]